MEEVRGSIPLSSTMANIDHLILACTDLAVGTKQVAELTGITAISGGPHPGVGTHNALLSLGDAVYLEVIAPDPDQPEPGGPRPFGIDDLLPGNTRLAKFAIHATLPETIDDVVAAMSAQGFDPGPVSAMSRVKPDGEQLNWQLTRSTADEPSLVPFVIDWGSTTHPATVTPTGVTLLSLSGAAPKPSATRLLHTALGLDITVSEGDDEISAVLNCPNGRVELR